MGRRSFAILIGIAVVVAVPAAAQERCAVAPADLLPFSFENGKVVMDVAVNGHPVRFAIDTGGYDSAVSARLAENMKLPVHLTVPGITTRDVGGTRAQRRAEVISLVVGKRSFARQRYAIADLPPGLDGLIAIDLLRGFDMDFDFAAGRLALYPQLACAGKPPGFAPFSAVLINLHGFFSPRSIHVPVLLDGKSVTAVLDTGANRSYIVEQEARERFGVALDKNAGRARGTFGGVAQVSPQDFSTLQIGDVLLRRPTLYVIGEEEDQAAAPVLLGLDQLRYLRLFVSFRDRTLYVSRPPGH